MRQKLFIFLLLGFLSQSLVFSHTADLEEFARLNNFSNSKVVAYQRIEFKAVMARMEYCTAKARLDAMKSHFLVQDLFWDEEDDAQIEDTSVEIIKANEEALYKREIAVEATKKAEAAYNQYGIAQIREAEEARKVQLRDTLSPAMRKALAMQAEEDKAKAIAEAAASVKKQQKQFRANEIVRKAEAKKETARQTKPDLETSPKAQLLADPQTRTEPSAMLEQEALDKAMAELDAMDAQKLATKKTEITKTNRKKVLYSGELFILVRDESADEASREEVGAQTAQPEK